ncbi:unnamed protein product [Nezara viridula]|uniref:Uncharacterized protein n=1 Tax=Nezara viridula TaxID=85310 RepID=A0A9P0H133_NEZVI|nr:unnamed protein product [Nezara viridula]
MNTYKIQAVFETKHGRPDYESGKYNIVN